MIIPEVLRSHECRFYLFNNRSCDRPAGRGGLFRAAPAPKGEQEKAEEALKNAFAVTAQEALRQSNEQFLQLAQEKLKHAQADGSHDLEKRQKAISEMVGPVKEHLTRLNSVVEQIQGTDKALRDDLKNLQRETAKLAGAMRDPAAQGRWGEFILERLLDKSGLIKGVHYETQVTLSSDGNRQRPDVVIKLQDGFNIVVDAKAPVNEFTERLQEDIPEAEYKEMLNKLARLVRDHVKKLGQKTYWENLDSPDFVVMFLPSEHLFSAGAAGRPESGGFCRRKPDCNRLPDPYDLARAGGRPVMAASRACQKRAGYFRARCRAL